MRIKGFYDEEITGGQVIAVPVGRVGTRTAFLVVNLTVIVRMLVIHSEGGHTDLLFYIQCMFAIVNIHVKIITC